MSSRQKILVLGGMHGNEPSGIELVGLIAARPIAGVEAVIANPRAVRLGKRFSQSDLNRSFGQVNKGTYEWRRARQLQKLCQSYDVVLDFHNTQSPNNNCSFIGETSKDKLLTLSLQLGMPRCIRASYDCINKYCSNALSIEISQGDKLDSAEYWYQQIQDLQTGKLGSPSGSPRVYRYVQRVTWQEARTNNIGNWQAFEPLTLRDKRIFGLKGTVVPIFIGSTLTEYYATLLRKEKVK